MLSPRACFHAQTLQFMVPLKGCLEAVALERAERWVVAGEFWFSLHLHMHELCLKLGGRRKGEAVETFSVSPLLLSMLWAWGQLRLLHW